MFAVTVWLEEQGSQCRAQRQRVERADDCRGRNGQRELTVKLSADAGHERSRYKHGTQYQCNGNDWSRNFFHRLAAGIAWRHSFGQPALDVLDNHDGVINY